MNFPTTHCERSIRLNNPKPVASFSRTYSLRLQMRAPQTVHVLIEVHHLEAVELIRHFLNVFLLIRLLDLDTFGIPAPNDQGQFRPVARSNATSLPLDVVAVLRRIARRP